ncbi:carboxypeptidase regulatory-like domain-containing protein, partial [Niallia circulans]|uniref:carboxypeptidase regulatory-like domain-containing protein n=1 Tax=Niallia circulans TaxID=1397 RepID=UPI0026EF4809
MAFPSNNQFTPFIINGSPVFDVVGDESPTDTDLVGNSIFPAGFFAYDGTNIYFRLRLNSDPRNSKLTAFDNFAWGVLINTSGTPGTYDWLFNVNGLRNNINLIQNTTKLVNSWNDPAEGLGGGTPNFTQAITNFDFARVTVADSTFGGNPDYFLDWFLPASTFFSVLGINENSPIRALVFTSTNANNYNKDSLQTSEGFSFADALSTPTTTSVADIRAKLATTKSLSSGPITITLGQQATWTGSITVSNTGKSTATSISLQDILGLDNITSFIVNSTTQGNTAYNASSKTLSWSVGNLGAGVTATLIFTLSGAFTIIRSPNNLDIVSATGFDSSSGSSIQSNSSAITINVQQVGSVNGTIIDNASGLPISGANVTLSQNGSPVSTAISNSNGFYSFTGLVPGQYTVTVNQTNYSPNSANVTAVSGQSTTQNLSLTPLPSTVSGAVTTSSGTAVPNAQITLTNNSGTPVAQTTTNASGNYSFTGIAPGSYTISVMVTNFQSQSQSIITQSNQTANVNFTLQPSPGAISGTITNAQTGTVIPNATVQLLSINGALMASTTTNTSGNYSFTGLAPGQYQIRAIGTNFSTNTVSAIVQADVTTNVGIALQPNPGTIQGTVTDNQTSQPVQGVNVQAVNSSGSIVSATITDSSGNYTFSGLLTGSYTLIFTSNGYANSTLGAIVQSNTVTTANSVLNRLAGNLTGTIRDVSNSPISGALVTVFSGNVPVATTTSDASGNYLINNLAPGNYVTVVTANNFSSQNQSVFILNGEVTNASFTLQPDPGSITGTVRDINNTAIIGANITLQLSTGSGVVVGTTLTNSDGSYVFNNIAPGNYTLVATASNFQTATQGVNVTSNQTSTTNFQLSPNPGTLSGSVTNSQTGTPISNANVQIRILDSSGALVSSVFTDQDGNYVIPQLAPGTYNILASANNFQTDGGTAIIAAGQNTVVNISLAPNPGRIQGQVTNTQPGTPIVGATINVVDQNGTLITTVLTNNTGAFQVEGLTPGNYTLNTFFNNFQNNSIGVTVQSNQTAITSIQLTPNPGNIQGTVVPALANTLIRLLNSDGLFIDSVVANTNGIFSFLNLAPNTYIVTATAPNFTTESAGVSVLANTTSNISLTLSPNPATVSGLITDTSGVSIPKAAIQVKDSNGTTVGTAFTDTQGAYSISNLSIGSLTLIVSSPGFGNVIRGISVGPGDVLTDVNFTLTPNPGSISGQVTNNQTGELIQGANITIRDSVSNSVVAITTTSELGTYFINNLSPNSYIVTASQNNFGTNQIGVLVVSDQTLVASLALSPDFGSISGIVIDSNGNPITGNGIQINIFNDNNVLVKSILANSDGTYAIDQLIPGNYLVIASAPNFSTTTTSAIVQSDQTTSITSILTANPVTLSAQVVNIDSQSVLPGATVTVKNSSNVTVGSGVTDANGTVVITNLPPGNLMISANANNFGTDTRSIFVTPGQSVSETLALTPNPGNLNGFVSNLATGNAIPNAVIQLYNSANVLVDSIVTNQSGQYSFSGIAPGTYTAVSNASDFGPETAGAIIVSNQTATVSFALSPNPGVIQGIVTTSNTGDLIANAQVVVRELSTTGPIVFSTVTNAQGFYQTTTLSPRVYAVTVIKDNFGAVNLSAEVQSSQVTNLNFLLTPNPGAVQGTITDSFTGLPIINTSVQVINSSGTVASTVVSDSNGFYQINGISPGQYTILATNANYQSNTQGVQINSNQTSQVDFTLVSFPATLTGTVVDSTTAIPLVGAVVNILEQGTNTLIESTLTDGNGIYLAEGLPEGNIVVTTTFQNYASSVTSTFLTPNQTKVLNSALSPFPSTIVGTVTDSATANPISGVSVQLVVAQTGITVTSTVTSSDGTYNLANLPQGTFNIIFSTNNYASQTVTVILTPGEVETVNPSLTPNPATITGIVLDSATSTPLANALVQAFNSQGVFLASVLTDMNGQYTLSGLPEGTLTVEASAPNFGTGIQTVTLTAGQTQTLPFTLTPNPASLSGIVTDAQTGSPITGALVQVFVVGTTIPVKSTLTDGTGQYLVSGLNEGEYRVVISADNYGTQPFRVVLTPGEQEILNAALTPNPATIQGTVTDAQTGSPISGAGVVTVIAGSGIIIASTQTDLNGNYIITGLSPGTYNVVFSADNFASQTVTVNLAPGEVETVSPSLTPNPATITGTVFDSATSTPLANALVQVFNSQGVFLASVLTDMNGQYTLSGLPEGTLTVEASAPNFGTGIQTVTLTAGQTQTLPFTLTPNPASLSGIVTDAQTGSPITGALVQVFVVGTTIPVKSTLTDGTGQYLVSGLNEGEYRVVISADNYGTQPFRVVLTPGEQEILNAALTPNPATIQGTVTDAQTGSPIS